MIKGDFEFDFDRGHLLAFLGYLDAISHQKKSTVYPEDMGVDGGGGSDPSTGKCAQFQTAPMVKI